PRRRGHSLSPRFGVAEFSAVWAYTPKMVEYRADHAHFFTLTLKNEQPNSRLNQALARHIDSKIHSLVIMTRNDGVTRRENVVVSKSATKEPNDYRLSIIGPSNRQTVQSKRC
ncbi:hypothetical protein, partial [Aeromonas sp. QDB11]|uniref:hypothetical protein n=1 Tax=Aeromonas sp. QDB11 TaxID=2990482 RepID=UPI0022DECEC8